MVLFILKIHAKKVKKKKKKIAMELTQFAKQGYSILEVNYPNFYKIYDIQFIEIHEKEIKTKT